MQIYAKSNNPVTILTKSEKPWEMEGRKGTTLRFGILAGDDIDKIKCVNQEAFDNVILGESYYVTFLVEVVNGSVREVRISDICLARDSKATPSSPGKDAGNGK